MVSKIGTIKGLGLTKPNAYPNVEKLEYQPAELRGFDVDIKIIACGICGSDLHKAKGDWGTPLLPLIPGHEIVGYIVNKGSDVNDDEFKIGDRVGVGPLADCCGNCYRCTKGFENNCRGMVLTSGNFKHLPYRQGGYASHIRVNSKFAFKIPENIASEHAAPLLCGGMTGLSPLLVTGVTKGTCVAICGIGGIGHMSIMFAKALGAEVTAISSSEKKKDLAFKLGADHYISTDDSDYADKNLDAFDVIVHTGSFMNSDVLSEMLKMIRPNGRLQIISGPASTDRVINLDFFALLMNNANIGGVTSGSPSQLKFMLDLASENNIAPLIETIDINENNVKSAWKRLDAGDVRFRFVLTGYDKFFG